MSGDEESILAGDQVHVWFARPTVFSADALARCAALLSEEERARVARFHFERNRRESTVSRALVRATLARYLGSPATSFAYRLGPHGRPHVEPPSALDFNATNHPDLVACAVVRDGVVGVDVEPLSRGDQILGVAPSVFSAPERDALDALADDARRDRAVSLWTCKEAYIKARGFGLSGPLQEIVVEYPPGASPTIRFLEGVDVPSGWSLAMRDFHDCRIAVAARTRSGTMEMVVREASWLYDS